MAPDADGLSIRPYEEADRIALIALWRRCELVGADTDRSIDFALGRDHTALLVGMVSGVVVASVLVGHDGHVGFLYLVAVDPAHRGKGWGRSVMQAGEAWLATHHVWRTMLMVRPDNAGVVGFYQRLGWETVPNIVMQKRLLP